MSKIIEKIEEATKLDRAIKALTEQLATLKDDIRADALKKAAHNGDNKVEYQTQLGVCTVVMVKDRADIVKGVDPMALVGILPAEAWDGLFLEKVVINTKEFEGTYAGLTKAQAKVVEGFIEHKPVEPRVTFPK